MLLSCQLTIAAANITRLTAASAVHYLEHQAEEDDHGQTRHHVGVILDHKLVAQHRRALVLLAETHRSSTRLRLLWLRASVTESSLVVGASLSPLHGCCRPGRRNWWMFGVVAPLRSVSTVNPLLACLKTVMKMHRTKSNTTAEHPLFSCLVKSDDGPSHFKTPFMNRPVTLT